MKSLDKITNNHETIDQVKKTPSNKINLFSLITMAGQSQNSDLTNTKNDTTKQTTNKRFQLNANIVDNIQANKIIQPENNMFNKNATVLDSVLIKENPNIKGTLIPKLDTYAELIKTSNELKSVMHF